MWMEKSNMHHNHEHVLLVFISLLVKTSCTYVDEEILDYSGQVSLSFNSNGFPDQKYEHGAQGRVYYYRVSNEHSSGIVEGIFDDFDLAPNQKIEVFYSGAAVGSPAVTYVEGDSTKKRPNFISTSHQVVIKFTNPKRQLSTLDIIGYVGWRITCKFHFEKQTAAYFFPKLDCGEILNPLGGSFDYKFDFIKLYNKYVDCTWSIKTGNMSHAYLKLLKFDQHTYSTFYVRTSNNSVNGQKYNVFNTRSRSFTSRQGLYIRILTHPLAGYRSYELKFVYMPFQKARGPCLRDDNTLSRNDFCCKGDQNGHWMISWSLRCDGKKQCPHGDDEDSKVCSEATYGGTANGRHCISTCLLADDKHEQRWCHTLFSSWGYCPSSVSDTNKLAVKPPTRSPTGQLCSYGYSNMRRCPNGVCSRVFPLGCPSNCLFNRWKCDDSYCIQYNRVCDGIIHCMDGSDETTRACSTTTTTTQSPPECSSWEWRCRRDYSCISSSSVCDNYNDCDDGSDEENCVSKVESSSSSTTLTIPIIAGVSVLCLFVIIIVVVIISCKRRSIRASGLRRRGMQSESHASTTAGRPHVVYQPAQGSANIHTCSPLTAASAPPEYPAQSSPLVQPSAPPMPSAPPIDSNNFPPLLSPGHDEAAPPAYDDVMRGAYMHQPGQEGKPGSSPGTNC